MSELKSYDIAANKFYDTLKINSYPINSWDFYSSEFNTVCKNYEDISVLENLAKDRGWTCANTFNIDLIEKEHVIVVTDRHLNIVHATHNIENMNGYKSKEVLGKKPTMFQGAETCKKTRARIGAAVKNKISFEAVIVNYRKDGSKYKCWIKADPVLNNTGEVVNFIAYEKEVA